MVSSYPEVIIESLRQDHDFMIIACDGIWDCLTSQQAVDFVYETRNKLNKRQQTMKDGGSSPLKSNGSTKTSSGRKSINSPTKKVLNKGSGSGSPGMKGGASGL